jgi:hypothetical protein
MALTKQAKVVKKTELGRLLQHVERSRHPERDRVMILLSFKAGLRAKEIAELTWAMAPRLVQPAAIPQPDDGSNPVADDLTVLWAAEKIAGAVTASPAL